MDGYQVRAHHGMCFAFFRGRGYGDAFVKHMYYIKKELEKNPKVCLVRKADAVCTRCPNNRNGICVTSQLVEDYDRQVLELCDLPEGISIDWAEFSGLVWERIIKAGKRETICGNCEWSPFCKEVKV